VHGANTKKKGLYAYFHTQVYSRKLVSHCCHCFDKGLLAPPRV
jgi:hypothetical protein